MKVMIGVAHPKHVYIFKNLIKLLISRGHEVKVVAVKKEVTTDLLDEFEIEYDVIGTNQKSILKKILYLVLLEFNTLIIAIKFQPDVVVGRALPPLAHISYLLKKPFIIFEDTEIANVAHKLAIPFTRSVVTPYCYNGSFGNKHLRFNSLFELSYLNKSSFVPDSSVLDNLGLRETDRFILLRFVSWNATHDQGHFGLSNTAKSKIISVLEKYGKVLVSSEEKLDSTFDKYVVSIRPDKLHSLLSFATLCISEGGTVAAEAALLGTPSIYVSPFGQNMGNFTELKKAGLLQCYDDHGNALSNAVQLIRSDNVKETFRDKRDKFVSNLEDPTSFMLDVIQNEVDIS